MSVSDKISEIKKIIQLVCDTLPVIVGLIKEIILTIKDVKTV